MIIDLPPQTEQMIIATAQAQGLTVAELLKQTFAEPDDLELLAEQHGLNCDDGAVFRLNEAESQALQAMLDNPTQPPALKEILALGKQHGFNFDWAYRH